MKRILLPLAGFLLFSNSLSAQAYQRPESEAPKQEFRSIWVATALGLDWPKTTTVTQQQQALRDIILRHHQMRMNAVVFQVTARGDAHFYSERLPWAIRMTGTMGQDPGWDPLQFVIDESKKYGLEVHAWYNVFNVGNASELNAYAVASEPEHITKSNPEWVQDFSGGIWMNPGIPAARQWAVDNVREIVENYDVDAIHFDFARYPAAFTGDVNTRQTYDPDFDPTASMDAWRRNNVNQFQRDAFAAVQEIKPWVKVGTSPIGHYQSSAWPAGQCPYAPTGPCSWAANLAYFQVFQDAIAWISEGVNDYIAPQLYWAIGPPGPHFEYLAQNWRDITEASGKHVYIGIGAYQNTAGTNVAAQLAIQVDTIRANNHAGHMFFRYDNIYGPGGPTNNFQNVPKIDYQHRAFVPVMDWKDMDVPPAVEITREMPVASILDNSITVTWDAPDFETTSGDTKVSYAVYRVAAFNEPDPTTVIMDPANLLALTGETSYTDLPDNTEGENYYYFVTPYSRNWVEGAPSNVVEFFTPTSIESGDQLASQFKLEQNYPNPFNPSTQIRFTLGEATHATLTVYDIMGREVATLVDQPMAAGSHRVQFNASELSSGLYVYSLRAGSFIQTNKMMLIK
jgi:uncharacterized lipoprotein YddW (UPF0748 family)